MQSSTRTWGAAAALIVGITISSFLLSIVAAQDATPVVPVEASDTQMDSGKAATNQERAQNGTIFFARVAEVVQLRRENEGTPDDPFPLIIYAVDVERSLRDNVSGRVNVSFYDPRLNLTRKESSGPLTIGERYLFFPGDLSSRGAYPVSLDDGFLPVRDDKHAEELIAEFTPLVRQAEQEERDLRTQLAEAGRTEPKTQPAATLSPSRGNAGGKVTISGSGFTPAEVMLIWDDGSAELIEAQADGRFEATMTVPKGLRRGNHTIEIIGLGSDQAEVTFIVE